MPRRSLNDNHLPGVKTIGPARSSPAAVAPAPGPIKVALVEDQPEVRASWTRLINSFPDFVCSCSCATAAEAQHAIPRDRPDIVLMDIFLPLYSGLACIGQLKAQLPQTQIVILTALGEQELVFKALEA